MFADHQYRIADFGQTNADNMAKVLTFVIVTIRNRLFNCASDMETIEHSTNAQELQGALYGFKSQSVDQIRAEKDSLYDQAMQIWHDRESDRQCAETMLNLFTLIHGFGLAKAGFACQLLFGVSACLDSHNIERFSINPNHIRSGRLKGSKTLKNRWKVIRQYCDFVDKCGGTESLWDSWCIYVFNRPDPLGLKMNRNESYYRSADHVSALHCEAIGIEASYNA